MNTTESNEALARSWAKAYAPFTDEDETRAIRDEFAWRKEQEQNDSHQTRSKYRALGVAGFVVSCLLGIGLALFLLTFGAR